MTADTAVNTIPSENKAVINIVGTYGITQWLSQQNISLAFTSYQLGKFFLIGRHSSSGISVFQRNFVRCMGLAMDYKNDHIYLSSLHTIWKFKNVLRQGESFRGYDRLYSPVTCYFTGEIDIHDMGILANGQLIFVNNRFSCLATLSESYSFEPVWKPAFITELVPEDRCHLNGLAIENGKARYVTYFSQTNTFQGWRDYKENGGGVIDIETNEIICSGLSMPHSPRVYQDKLWLLNSGTGYLGYVDMKEGKFVDVFFCPGYLRGLQFFGDYAIVGISHMRPSSVIKAVQLEENLQKHNQQFHCGILFINLKTLKLEHSLEMVGRLSEIYEIGILPGVVKPSAMGIEEEEIRRVVTIPAALHFNQHDEFIFLDQIKRLT